MSSPPTNLSQESNAPGKCLGIIGSMVLGGFGFAVVGVIGFSVWALFGKWLHERVGELGLFGACTFVFVGLSGAILHPLIRGPKRIARFYSTFIPAFFAYAVVWSVAWFALHFGFGEWLASLLGCLAFASVACWRFGSYRSFVAVGAVLFVLHSVGYFFGAISMHWIGSSGSGLLGNFSKAQLSSAAKLTWGLVYGFGFGAGIGYTFFTFQMNSKRDLSEFKESE